MLNENQQEELESNEKLLWRAEVWLGHVRRHRENGDNVHAENCAWELLCIIRDAEKAARQLYLNCKAGK
jgi:hypothetical protein